MIRTTVPEASVDEHGDPLAEEHHVWLGPPPAAEPDCEALAEPASAPMKDRPDGDLRARVAPLVRHHHRGRGRRRGRGPIGIAPVHAVGLPRTDHWRPVPTCARSRAHQIRSAIHFRPAKSQTAQTRIAVAGLAINPAPAMRGSPAQAGVFLRARALRHEVAVPIAYQIASVASQFASRRSPVRSRLAPPPS